jgi:hypothetical protein
MAVIPAKAGIHVALVQKRRWISAFAGMTAVWITLIRLREIGVDWRISSHMSEKFRVSTRPRRVHTSADRESLS